MTSARAFTFESFRLVWSSSLAMAAAQLMERVATGWLALQTTGSPLGVGIVLAARMLPSLLFGLASGTLADRWKRRRVLILVGASGALLSCTLGLLVGAGVVSFWQIATFAFLSGCVQVSDTPARQALVVDSVDRAAAPNAIALNAVASRLFGAVGAFFGGLIIPALGVADCYFAVALSYLLGVGVLAFVDVDAAGDRPGVIHPPFGRALSDAVTLIVKQATVRTLVLAAVACEIFGFSYMTAVPTFARDVLLAGAEGYGSLTAAAAIGATLAVVGLAVLPGGVRREPLLAGVYLGYGAGLVALASATSLPIALLAVLLVGASAAAFDTLQQTLIQLSVPDDKRGRAVGIWVFSIGTAPIGHLEVGVLASSIGAPATLLINGSLVLVGAVTLATQARAFRPRRARAH